MPLQKNQVLTLTIERLSNDGSGVAHSPDGEAVFVPGTAPGDEADIRIVKDCGRYAFGILDTLRTPSPDRIPVDCAVAGPCGGCSLRHLDYAAELRAKQENVVDAFRRIGGLDVPVLDALPSPEVDRYRNKVQFPVGRDKNGAPCIGFYAGRTHRIVPCPDCKLQPGILNNIGNALCSFFGAHGIQPYDEASGLQLAVGAGDDAVGASGVEADAGCAVLITPDRELDLVAVAVHFGGGEGVQHRHVQPADAAERIDDVFLFGPKLGGVIQVPQAAAAAGACHGAVYRDAVRRGGAQGVQNAEGIAAAVLDDADVGFIAGGGAGHEHGLAVRRVRHAASVVGKPLDGQGQHLIFL
jgi:predicted RNA-binding protein with TRAM domain